MFRNTHRARAGFTLFEVGISLLLMSVGVLTVLMLMPMGIKAQQMSRYQLLASAKAIDVLSVNTNQWRKWDRQRLEARGPGNNSINAVAHAPLAEQKASNWRHGCLPLPMDIARRLDSDGDEIQQVLDAGGVLFYSSPRANSSIAEGDLANDDRALPNEAQKLVFAFVGYAQQYALVNHPNKAWPYYDWYPVPPRGRPGGSLTTAAPPFPRHEDAWVLGGWSGLSEFRALFAAWRALPVAPAVAPLADVEAYRDLAKTLATTVGVTLDADGVPADPPGSPLDTVTPNRVLAVSYVAQAMVWLTSPAYNASPQAAAYRDQAQRAHEMSLKWERRYTTTDPYDWGADRALNFQNAWDHPLLQYELFSSTAPAAGLATPLFAANGVDRSWRVLSPRPVTNVGCSNSTSRSATGTSGLGNQPELQASWGDPATFNLTAPFAATQRCRQLVFWAVDWQSYEDFEAAPSAPIDASKFPYDSAGAAAYNNGAHKFGNPEVFFVFGDASRTTIPANQGAAVGNRALFMGLHGADRNGNQRFDRGSNPTSTRLRATTVSRFNFYNPRVWCGLKN